MLSGAPSCHRRGQTNACEAGSGHKGKPAAKRNPAQREILLPLAGGAPPKEAPAKQEQKPGAQKKRVSLSLQAASRTAMK
jgi:hypothetical protein